MEKRLILIGISGGCLGRFKAEIVPFKGGYQLPH